MKTSITVIYGDHTLKIPFEIDSATVKSDDLLEEVWAGMNHGSCREFPWFQGIKSRSLSVGDFVQIGEAGVWSQKIIYQVASVGFKRVSAEHMETFMKEVKTLMNSGKHPWSALCEVEWKYQKVDA